MSLGDLKYKAVLFDLDDTLCKTSDSKKEVFEKLHKSNESLQVVPSAKFVSFILEERERYLEQVDGLQTFTRLEMWDAVKREFKLHFSTRDLRKLIDDYWELSFSKLELYKGVNNTLGLLFDSNILTALLAGGDFYSKSGKLIHLNIDMYFNYVFTADLVRIPKTSKDIYEYVINFLKLCPEEVLMVGNDLSQDVAPANDAGLATALAMIDRKADIPMRGNRRPKYVLNEIKGVSDIVGVS